ncbi:MAG: hypothetical protein HYX32_04035 [Actinobacteria bacterium]|nr:hypothetical protein [Actinomycetota bacterium]
MPDPRRSLMARSRNRLIALLLAAAGVSACAGAAAPPATTTTLLSVSQLCDRVPPAAINGALGEAWQRVDDPSGRCRYQSATNRTSTVTVAATTLTADTWRREAERAGGKVTEKDGLLIADYAGDGFGPLDEIWWADAAPALVVRADGGVTLDQAMAIIALARRASPDAN